MPTGSLVEEKGSLEEVETGPQGTHSFPHPGLSPSKAVDFLLLTSFQSERMSDTPTPDLPLLWYIHWVEGMGGESVLPSERAGPGGGKHGTQTASSTGNDILSPS